MVVLNVARVSRLGAVSASDQVCHDCGHFIESGDSVDAEVLLMMMILMMVMANHH